MKIVPNRYQPYVGMRFYWKNTPERIIQIINIDNDHCILMDNHNLSSLLLVNKLSGFIKIKAIKVL